MPITLIQTSHDLLESLTVDQLKSRIRTLNSNGHTLNSTGNKSLLIDRIYYAENPHITPPTPTLSTTTTTAIDTQTALAQVVTITSEVTKSHAAGILSSLTVLAKEIRRTFDPNNENWKAQVSSARKGLKDAVALEGKFLSPVIDGVDVIKSRIAAYELAQRQQQQLEQRQLEKSASSLARDALLERVLQLYDDGRDKEAENLELSLDSGGLETATAIALARAPQPTPVKVVGISTTFKWCWKLVGLHMLKRDHTRIVADTNKIDAAVKLHGIAAIELVSGRGLSAIEVWQEANTRGTGR